MTPSTHDTINTWHHQHGQSSTPDNHQQRTTIRSHLTTININHYQTTINTGQPSTPDNHQQCSITSEALLWILCSWRSNDIQAILAICWTRVSRTQEARHWTTLFQDVKFNTGQSSLITPPNFWHKNLDKIKMFNWTQILEIVPSPPQGLTRSKDNNKTWYLPQMFGTKISHKVSCCEILPCSWWLSGVDDWCWWLSGKEWTCWWWMFMVVRIYGCPVLMVVRIDGCHVLMIVRVDSCLV